jgi:hypothetical protein
MHRRWLLLWCDALISLLITFSYADAVKNHGISEEVIALALDSMKTYFALPLETKMEA